MKALPALALNTFREAVRDRVLYVLLFFAVLLILGSEGLSSLAVGDPTRIVIDLGLGAISFFGVLISAFLGLALVSKEIARKTLYTVITKPISRASFIIGKLLGLFAVVVILTAAMTLLFLLFVWLRHGIYDPRVFAVVALMLVEDLIIASFAILFSAFTTPILATLLTMTIYVIGHVSYGIKLLAAHPNIVDTVWHHALMAVYFVLPNLERLNLKNAIVVTEAFPGGVLAPAAYGVIYSMALVLIATEAFRRKDFI